MKKVISLVIATLSLSSALSATVTLSGTALSNASGLSVGDVGILLVDKTSDFSGFGSLVEGNDIFDTNFYGSNFEVVGNNTAVSSFGAIRMLINNETISLTGGVDTGDQFAFLVYENSTTTSLVGDTYRIYTSSDWLLPADTATMTGGTDFTIVSGAPIFTGTVSAVPEPSSFALLAGCFGLAWVMVRRRS